MRGCPGPRPLLARPSARGLRRPRRSARAAFFALAAGVAARRGACRARARGVVQGQGHHFRGGAERSSSRRRRRNAAQGIGGSPKGLDECARVPGAGWRCWSAAAAVARGAQVGHGGGSAGARFGVLVTCVLLWSFIWCLFETSGLCFVCFCGNRPGLGGVRCSANYGAGWLETSYHL